MGLAIQQVVPADAVPHILRFTWTALKRPWGQAPELPPVPPLQVGPG